MTISIIFYVVFDYSFYCFSLSLFLYSPLPLCLALLTWLRFYCQRLRVSCRCEWTQVSKIQLEQKQWVSPRHSFSSVSVWVGFRLEEFMVYGILLVLSNYLCCFCVCLSLFFFFFLFYFYFFSLFSCCCTAGGSQPFVSKSVFKRINCQHILPACMCLPLSLSL